MDTKKPVYIIILIFVPLSLFYADNYELSDFFSEDSMERDWVVGFTSLEGIELVSGNQYLVHSIPQLIVEKMSVPLEHIYKPPEREEYQKSLLEAELSKIINQLITGKSEFDELYFNNPNTAEYKGAYDSYITEKNELEKKIEFLRSVDYRDIPFPETSPVKVYNSENQDVLIEYPDFSVYEYARINDIDLIISGEIEQIQEYFYIKIYAVHTKTKSEVFVFENALSAETVYDFLPELTDELIGIILGREWANLTVIPNPSDSIVQVNGEVKGIGVIQEDYINPGMVEVEVFHSGYESVKKTVFINSFHDTVMEINLEKKDTKALLLDSEPIGADVYLNSYWIGKTPLMIDLPYESQLLIMKKEGYDELSYQFTEEIPEKLRFALREDNIDELYWHEQKRKRFYAVMGAWLISLPLPFIINDYAVDIENTRPESSNMQRRLKVLQFMKRAGIILTAGLFFNTIIHLIEYLNYSRQLLPEGLEED